MTAVIAPFVFPGIDPGTIAAVQSLASLFHPRRAEVGEHSAVASGTVISERDPEDCGGKGFGVSFLGPLMTPTDRNRHGLTAGIHLTDHPWLEVIGRRNSEVGRWTRCGDGQDDGAGARPDPRSMARGPQVQPFFSLCKRSPLLPHVAARSTGHMAATRPNLGTCPDRPQRVGDGCCVCLTLSLAQGDLRHKRQSASLLPPRSRRLDRPGGWARDQHRYPSPSGRSSSLGRGGKEKTGKRREQGK